jgi:hypothetical protein
VQHGRLGERAAGCSVPLDHAALDVHPRADPAVRAVDAVDDEERREAGLDLDVDDGELEEIRFETTSREHDDITPPAHDDVHHVLVVSLDDARVGTVDALTVDDELEVSVSYFAKRLS